MNNQENVVTFQDNAEQSQYCIKFYDLDGQDLFHYLDSVMFTKIIPNF